MEYSIKHHMTFELKYNKKTWSDIEFVRILKQIEKELVYGHLWSIILIIEESI